MTSRNLLIHLAARGADDLHRVVGDILGIKGVERTSTALVISRMVDHRIRPLIENSSTGTGHHSSVPVLSDLLTSLTRLIRRSRVAS